MLHRDLVDRWIKTRDRESFLMARRLIRQEGLLVGGSSGAAVWAAVELAKETGPDKRICIVLPDSVRNYMTKFVDDSWMRQHGFSSPHAELGSVGDLTRTLGTRTVITVEDDKTLDFAVKLFKAHGISQMPCTADGRLSGIVTESDVLHFLVDGRSPETPLAEVMVRRVSTVGEDEPAASLPALFERGEVAIVVDAERRPISILTKMDFIDVLSRRARLRAS